jgi:galactokinase
VHEKANDLVSLEGVMSGTELSEIFETQFKRKNTLVAQAPGRVNLIGEHTDYNDGFVFPAAIDRYITILASPREDEVVQAFSVDYDQCNSFRLSSIEPSQEAPWSNYLRGVYQQFLNRGFRPLGADLVLSGNVPLGAGLSSSAALEVVTAETVRVLSAVEISGVELALLCQAAEHDFVGVQCGIMDQFVSALAQQGKALFVDCRDLSYRPVPLRDDLSVVVCDSKVQRKLDSSEYNKRRSECESSVEILAEKVGEIKALRDVSQEQLETHKNLLPDLLYRRAHHVVSENERVLKAIDLLERGEVEQFGELLYQSHISLRDDYEVSCEELDILVELASDAPGVLGSRMTGAGFGGCTVSLVNASASEAFCEFVRRGYKDRTGIEANAYVCDPSAGVSHQTV